MCWIVRCDSGEPAHDVAAFGDTREAAIVAWNLRSLSQAGAKLDAVREMLGELEPATIETDSGDLDYYGLETVDNWIDKLREIVK
jgi:hypothetical protein